MDAPEVIFSVDSDACAPRISNRTRKVMAWSWGICPICRMTARCVGGREILEGSMWCAAECPRRGEWACQEEATMAMVYAWRAWAVGHFALALRDEARQARTCSDIYRGQHPSVVAARGEPIHVRVLA